MTTPQPTSAGAPVAGLVLAAGAGRRLGEPKAHLEVGGERLVDRAARVLREGGCAPVLVVLGAQVADVPGADVVVGHDGWADGMGSSLRAGLAAAAGVGAGAVVVVLVDQPGVGADEVRGLVTARVDGVGLAVTGYGGQWGHPVLLGTEHWEGVARGAVGEAGARYYLRAHAADVEVVASARAEPPPDIDTAAGLDAARVDAGEGPTGPT